MYGLPDSAVYGTYKRAKYRATRKQRRGQQTHPLFQVIGWIAFVIVVIVFVL